METLLEKAKKIKRKHTPDDYSNEEIELAIAWVKGDITTGQVVRVQNNKKAGNILYSVAIALREGYKRKKFKIN